MELVKNCSSSINDYIEKFCDGQPAWKVITASVAATIAFFWAKEFMCQNESVALRSKKKILKLIRKFPFIRNKIETELSKISSGILQQMQDSINNDSYIGHLPERGWSKEKILQESKNYIDYGSCKWEEGYASGAVYNGNEALTELMTEVYGMSVWTNPLHSDVFPGVRKMEAEVIRMCCSMFHGGLQSCGTMTTGGTESIIMACKAYRDYAVEVKGIKHPEILAPVTAHAAFDKAAQFLNINISHAPIDSKTMKVDVKALRKMITKNTCMIVGSAPQFPHGALDPIQELAALGSQYNIPVHVDACLGGFLIPFAADAGFPLPPFDFRLEGVTSISCDTHKYGFSPKGSSVILYREPKYRHHQFFVQPDWPGGIYATPSMSGSRPGGIIAATWAALVYYGKHGYVECTRKILETARKIEKGCRQTEGIFVLGYPEVSVVAIGSNRFNIYTLSDAMTKKGWNLNALQFPSCIHIAVTVLHTQEGVAERFLADIREITSELLKKPPDDPGESAAIYGLAQSIPDRTVVNEVGWCYLDACYNTTGSLETEKFNRPPS